MKNGLVPHPRVVDKNLGGIFWEQGVPAPYQAPAQGSSARKISPHNFWLQNQAGTESVEETSGLPTVALKEVTDGLTQTHPL